MTADELHQAIDQALDLVADCLYDLPHATPRNVDQLAAQFLAAMVAVHVERATDPSDFLNRLRAGQHALVAAEEQTP